jgi:hypothetical protein
MKKNQLATTSGISGKKPTPQACTRFPKPFCKKATAPSPVQWQGRIWGSPEF